MLPRRVRPARPLRLARHRCSPPLRSASGSLVLRAVAGGPHALALLAAIATPVLAAARPQRAPLAVALWLVAWLAHGLVAEAAAVALIALAAVTVAEIAARARAALVARRGARRARDRRRGARLGDARRSGPATTALHNAAVPVSGRPSDPAPPGRDVRFGDDGLARPPRRGVTRGHRARTPARGGRHRTRRGRLGPAPARHSDRPGYRADARRSRSSAGSSDARRRRLRHPREPPRARGGARGDRRGCPRRALVPRRPRRLRPEAERMLSLVQARASVCLCGNHDLGVRGTIDLAEFSGDAGAAAIWTREVLDDEARSFLDGLEPSGEAAGVALFHGSARDPVWEYVLSDEAAVDDAPLTAEPLVLVGHSHARCRSRSADGQLEGGLAPAGPELELARRALAPQSRLGRPAPRRRPARGLSPARPRRTAGELPPGGVRHREDAVRDTPGGATGAARPAARSGPVAARRSWRRLRLRAWPARRRRTGCPRAQARPGRPRAPCRCAT